MLDFESMHWDVYHVHPNNSEEVQSSGVNITLLPHWQSHVHALYSPEPFQG